MKPVTTIMNLASLGGLTRQEIQRIQWHHIHYDSQEIRLPQRTIPLCPELSDYLQALQRKQGWWPPYLVPGRGGNPMSATSISRLVAQENTSLNALRHDYIAHQLTLRPWMSVSRETGLGEEALRRQFHVKLAQTTAQPDEYSLARAVESMGQTLGAFAVCLVYDGGYQVGALRQLTWDTQETWLPSQRTRRLVAALDKPTTWVFPNAQGTAPLDAPRLSRLGRNALVGAGLDGVTLQTLSQGYNLRQGDGALARTLLQQDDAFTITQALPLFGDSRTKVQRRLQVLVKAGALVQVGSLYYDGRTVPPSCDHQQLVLELVTTHQVIYRSDVVRTLQIRPRQCRDLLKRMVHQGLLAQNGQQYFLNGKLRIENGK